MVRSWRLFYPGYVRYIGSLRLPAKTKRWRTLVRLKEYVIKNNLNTIEALSESSVETFVPKVFPVTDQSYLSMQERKAHFPSVDIVTIRDAVVHGGTNLVFVHDEVIHHDLYDFEQDYTSEELLGRHVIDAKRSQIQLLYDDVAPFQMSVAACFVDACAKNYAHWITEVLTRIVAFCTVEQYADIPLIVDEGLHPNIMQSLYAISGPTRQIVVLPASRAIKVDSLLVTSVAGYIPFERRGGAPSKHTYGAFSASALRQLRTIIFSYTDKISTEDLPEKIYLERGQTHRSVINEDQIIASLIKIGFSTIRLENLDFIQQVAILRHAKVVVGPTGAALANLIFSDRAQSVHILIAKLPDMPYSYWPNMVAINGMCVNYILGQASNLKQGIHASFYVDTESLIESISSTS